MDVKIRAAAISRPRCEEAILRRIGDARFLAGSRLIAAAGRGFAADGAQTLNRSNCAESPGSRRGLGAEQQPRNCGVVRSLELRDDLPNHFTTVGRFPGWAGVMLSQARARF